MPPQDHGDPEEKTAGNPNPQGQGLLPWEGLGKPECRESKFILGNVSECELVMAHLFRSCFSFLAKAAPHHFSKERQPMPALVFVRDGVADQSRWFFLASKLLQPVITLSHDPELLRVKEYSSALQSNQIFTRRPPTHLKIDLYQRVSTPLDCCDRGQRAIDT